MLRNKFLSWSYKSNQFGEGDLGRFARISWLRSTLRKAPLWAEGHLFLARLELEEGQLTVAFACVHPAILLWKQESASFRDACRVIVAHCYRVFSNSKKALEILSQIETNSPEVLFEKATTLAGAGEKDRAREVFAQLPIEKDTAEMRALREYVK